MLRDELSGCARGLRVAAGARAQLCVFTAQPGGAELAQRLEELGLCAEARGPVLAILPGPRLIDALAARAERWAAGDCPGSCADCRACAAGRLSRAVDALGAPAPGYMARAFVRELSVLRPGQGADDLALAARGLRLLEGPCDAAQRRAYACCVHRAAARALRIGAPGDGLRACAYIMALGGMEI